MDIPVRKNESNHHLQVECFSKRRVDQIIERYTRERRLFIRSIELRQKNVFWKWFRHTKCREKPQGINQSDENLDNINPQSTEANNQICDISRVCDMPSISNIEDDIQNDSKTQLSSCFWTNDENIRMEPDGNWSKQKNYELKSAIKCLCSLDGRGLRRSVTRKRNHFTRYLNSINKLYR